MATFGPEVADAYISVHANTEAFRRELRAALAKDMRALVKKSTRGFEEDLNLEKKAKLAAFRKALRHAAVTGDWDSLRRQFKDTGDFASQVNRELMYMSRLVQEVKDKEGQTVKRPFITPERYEELRASLAKYLDLLRSQEELAGVTRQNRQWAEQLKTIRAITPEVEDMGRALEEMNRKATEAERRRLGANVQDYDRYVASVKAGLAQIEAIKRRQDEDEKRARLEIQRLNEKDFRARRLMREEEEREQKRISTHYERLARQYSAAADAWIKEEARKREAGERMLRLQVRAEREYEAFRTRQDRRMSAQYSKFYDGLRHSRSELIHGTAVALDLISTLIGRVVETSVKGFDRMLTYMKPGGGQRFLSDLQSGFGALAAAVKTNVPVIAATVIALGTSFFLLATAVGTVVSLLSGLMGILTGVISSLGMALMSLIPLAGAFGGVAYGIGLAVAAFKDMDRYLPGAVKSLENLKRVFSEIDVTAFAEGIEEPLDRLFTTLAKNLEFDTVAGALGRAFGSIIDSVTGVMESAGWKSFMDALETTIPDAIAGLGGGFSGVMEGLFSAFGAGGPAVKKMGDAFNDFGRRFADTMAEMDKSGRLDKFFDLAADSMIVVSDLAFSVGEALLGLFEAAGPAGNDMLESITGLVKEFTTWVTSAGGKNQVAEWMEFAKDVASELWGVIKEVGVQFKRLDTPENRQFALNLLNSITSLITGIGNVISWFNNLNVNAVNALNSARAWAAGAEQAIEDFFTGIGEKAGRVGDWFGRVWQGIVDWWNQVDWGSLAGDVWQGFLNGMTEAWGNFTTWVSDTFGPFIDSVKQVFGVASPSTVFADIGRDVIQGLWDGVVEKWNAFKKWFEDAIKGIVATVSAKWDEIRAGASAKWETIKAAIASKVDSIRTTISTKWNEIKSTVSAKVEEIRASLSAKWESIKAKVSETWNSVRSTVVTKWNEIKSAVSSKINEVVTVVGTLPGKAVSALASVGTKLYQSGKNLVQGFIDGIRVSARWVWDAAVGVANRAVKAVKTALGMKSPSRVFRDIGINVGRGMELGILDRTGAVQAAMEKMVAVPKDVGGFASTALTGSRAYTTNNSRVVNVAPGAIQVSSRATSPRLVAGMILDDMALRIGG